MYPDSEPDRFRLNNLGDSVSRGLGIPYSSILGVTHMSDEQAMEKMTIIIYPSGKVSIQLPKTHEENVTCLLGVNDAKFQATCQAPHRTVIAYMDHAYINVDTLK